MKLIELIEAQLEEGRKETFMAMMPVQLQADEFFNDFFTKELNWALITLKKQDRIVWYLKMSKGAILAHYELQPVSGENPEIDNLVKKELNRIQTEFPDVNFKRLSNSSLRSHLEHFLSLNLPKINSIVFGKQTPDELNAQMAEVEQKWKAERKEVIPQTKITDNTTLLIKFPDGMQWVNLNTPSCDIEGQAMGHCGNAASGREGQTILSLREPVKSGWKPNLTFILDTDTGMLGEMKGRANQKPAAKYHPYIIALLKSPIIEGIKGGGYLPENNFSLGDLTKEQQDELVKLKPALGDLQYLYNKFGFNNLVREKLEGELDFLLEIKEVNKNNYVVLRTWENIPEFVEYFSNYGDRLENLETALDFIRGERQLEIPVTETEIETFFVESAKLEHPTELYSAIKQYIENKYPDETTKSPYDVLNVILENEEELYDKLKFSTEIAMQRGTLEHLRTAIDIHFERNHIIKHYADFEILPTISRGNLIIDQDVHLIIDIQKFIKMIGNIENDDGYGISGHTIENYIDWTLYIKDMDELSVDDYGWDQKAGEEVLVHDLPEEIKKIYDQKTSKE